MQLSPLTRQGWTDCRRLESDHPSQKTSSIVLPFMAADSWSAVCFQTPWAPSLPTLWRTEALTHSWLVAAWHLQFSSHAFLCLKLVTRQP